MQSKTLEIESGVGVVLTEIAGDVLVEGWDEATIAVDADEAAQPELELMDDAVHVSAQGDCIVRMPRDTDLEINRLTGDLRVVGTSGKTEIGTVAGDLALRDVGPVRVDTVAGDMSARAVEGDLLVETVAADAVVRRVGGALTLTKVGADLFVSDVDGDASATVGADATLFIAPRAGGTYSVLAGADIKCVLPDDASVDFALVCGAGAPRIGFPEIELEATNGSYRGVIGEGGATLLLTAGADIALVSGELGDDGAFAGDFYTEVGSDFEAWADDFGREMAVKAEMVAEQVGERLRHVASSMPDVLIAAGLPDKDAQRIAMRVEVAGQKAADRASRHAARASRRAGRQAAKAARRADRRAERQGAKRGGRGGRGGRGRHRAGGPAGDGISAEERLSILRMVEAGKLSVDEAERLLRALDDGQS